MVLPEGMRRRVRLLDADTVLRDVNIWLTEADLMPSGIPVENARDLTSTQASHVIKRLQELPDPLPEETP